MSQDQEKTPNTPSLTSENFTERVNKNVDYTVGNFEEPEIAVVSIGDDEVAESFFMVTEDSSLTSNDLIPVLAGIVDGVDEELAENSDQINRGNVISSLVNTLNREIAKINEDGL